MKEHQYQQAIALKGEIEQLVSVKMAVDNNQAGITTHTLKPEELFLGRYPSVRRAIVETLSKEIDRLSTEFDAL